MARVPGQATSPAPAPATEDDLPHEDEIGEYLKLPQIANTDWRVGWPQVVGGQQKALPQPCTNGAAVLGLPRVIGDGGAPLLHCRHRLLGQAHEFDCIHAREHRLH